MLQKIKVYIEKHGLIRRGGRIVVGVSGGADSLCLLDVLCCLKGEWGLELSAVHVHHGLRGESADRDAAFVEAFCRERGIPCRLYHEDAKKEAKERGLSVEEAGRELRYRRFQEWSRLWRGDSIAVAHHMDDQAETVLFQLSRGSGLRGAGGIRPVNGNIIRPLLCVTHSEIEGWLRSRGIPWCVDETNLENRYSRNRIRNELLPLMAEKLNPNVVRHLADLAEEFQQVEEYMETEEESLYRDTVTAAGEGYAVSDRLLQAPPLMQNRILLRALGETCGGRRDLTRVHVQQMQDILAGHAGRSLHLPGAVECWREKDRLMIGRKTAGKADKEELRLEVPGRYCIENQVLELKILSSKPEIFPEKAYTKWFDYDKIANGLVLRRRKPGDRITIDASGNHKKLKDYLIDRKIPRHKRDELLLLADDQEILWIIGERMSDRYKVGGETRVVLEVKFTGEKK